MSAAGGTRVAARETGHAAEALTVHQLGILGADPQRPWTRGTR